jgi:hypothetical protein
VVVTIAKLRTYSPAGERQFPHSPARAIQVAIRECYSIGLFAGGGRLVE